MDHRRFGADHLFHSFFSLLLCWQKESGAIYENDDDYCDLQQENGSNACALSNEDSSNEGTPEQKGAGRKRVTRPDARQPLSGTDGQGQ